MANPSVLSFQGKTKLTSAEFVEVFKKFDVDGKHFIYFSWRAFTIFRARPNPVLFCYYNFLCFLSGNGYIEAGELDEFLQALWKELKGKVLVSRISSALLTVTSRIQRVIYKAKVYEMQHRKSKHYFTAREYT